MDPKRITRSAALAGKERGRAELRHAKVRAHCVREQVVGKLKRSDDQRRCEPSPRPRSPRSALTGAVGIRGGVLEKGGRGGDGNGGRHALLDEAGVWEDKTRKG